MAAWALSQLMDSEEFRAYSAGRAPEPDPEAEMEWQLAEA